ncbi:type IV toxin-antitoxin system AbiEi family antitoxin domain-containing protein [Methanomassiliicoccus luminyensis]|uniref:type IV toxin-antitoxin system AbiEi family antitoxin domain-containing protein n=1 Tax=Methanomassiliicoccus luminyensis TaxID=1080712 RepID=UPI000375E53E|nr:hypothetical protein [Methanomassiliicoccus luminyensis]
MENKKRKSGGQKEIYISALKNKVITVSEARQIVKNDNTARMALWRLTKDGHLVRAKEGVYAAIPPEVSPDDYEINRYLLFDKVMNSSGAFAFHSALELHGAAYSAFSTVYYITVAKKPSFKFLEDVYRPVWVPTLFGITTARIDEFRIPVTDKERTFLDCLRRPDLSGGTEEYLKSVEAFTLMSSTKLLDYLRRFGEQSLYQRAGFVLSYLQSKIRVPDELLDVLRSHVGSNVYYLTPKKTNGRLNKEWNIMVPRNLEELVRYV